MRNDPLTGLLILDLALAIADFINAVIEQPSKAPIAECRPVDPVTYEILSQECPPR